MKLLHVVQGYTGAQTANQSEREKIIRALPLHAGCQLDSKMQSQWKARLPCDLQSADMQVAMQTHLAVLAAPLLLSFGIVGFNHHKGG